MISEFIREARTTINPKRQHELFREHKIVRFALTLNPNLIPEIFSQLFLEFQDAIMRAIKNINFKYNNPETQALLEKMIILL